MNVNEDSIVLTPPLELSNALVKELERTIQQSSDGPLRDKWPDVLKEIVSRAPAIAKQLRDDLVQLGAGEYLTRVEASIDRLARSQRIIVDLFPPVHDWFRQVALYLYWAFGSAIYGSGPGRVSNTVLGRQFYDSMLGRLYPTLDLPWLCPRCGKKGQLLVGPPCKKRPSHFGFSCKQCGHFESHGEYDDDILKNGVCSCDACTTTARQLAGAATDLLPRLRESLGAEVRRQAYELEVYVWDAVSKRESSPASALPPLAARVAESLVRVPRVSLFDALSSAMGPGFIHPYDFGKQAFTILCELVRVGIVSPAIEDLDSLDDTDILNRCFVENRANNWFEGGKRAREDANRLTAILRGFPQENLNAFQIWLDNVRDIGLSNERWIDYPCEIQWTVTPKGRGLEGTKNAKQQPETLYRYVRGFASRASERPNALRSIYHAPAQSLLWGKRDEVLEALRTEALEVAAKIRDELILDPAWGIESLVELESSLRAGKLAIPRNETPAVISLLRYAYWTLAKEVVGESGVGIGVLSATFHMQNPVLRKRVPNPPVSLACTACGASATVSGIVLGKDGVTEAKLVCDHCGHIEQMAGAANNMWDECSCPHCQVAIKTMLSGLAVASDGFAKGIVADIIGSIGPGKGENWFGDRDSVGSKTILQIALTIHEGYGLTDAVTAVLGGSQYNSLSPYSNDTYSPSWIESAIKFGLVRSIGKSTLPKPALPVFIAKQIEHKLAESNEPNSQTLCSLEQALSSQDLASVKIAMNAVHRLNWWGDADVLLGEREAVELNASNLPSLVGEALLDRVELGHIYEDQMKDQSRYGKMVRNLVFGSKPGFIADEMWASALRETET